MKDASMQKVKPFPSCPADSSETLAQLSMKAAEGVKASSEGHRRACRSAAMIGLAISMGATGMLLPTQQKQAVAAETKTWQLASNNLPLANKEADSSPEQEVALKPETATQESNAKENVPVPVPVIKHEVKQGETLWQLSEEYQVAPEAIAASNKIQADGSLLVGQKLKIPPVEGIIREVKSEKTIAQLAQAYGVGTQVIQPVSEKLPVGEAITIPGKVDYLLQQQQNNALKNLQEKRDRLSDSLAEGHPEESKINSRAEAGPTVRQPQVTALSPEARENQAIEIPVLLPESQQTPNPERQQQASVSSPIVIPVPAPENQAPTSSPAREGKVSRPVLLPVTTPTNQVSPNQARHSETSAFRSLPLPPAPISNTAPRAERESGQAVAFGQPITIPVPVPENLPVGNLESPQTALNTPVPGAPIQQERQVPPSLPQLGAPASPLSAMPSQQLHQVRPGDTLNSIARRYGISREQLIQANNIRNPNLIKINQQLVVPQTNLASNPRTTPTLMSGVPQSPDLDKLRTGVQLRQQEDQEQAQSNSEAISIAIQPRAFSENPGDSSSPEALNPEWSSDRQPEPSSATKQSEQQLAMRNGRYGTPLASSPRSDLISTAPSDPGNYNQIGNPVGEQVSPDLPLLSPEPYLPDGQSFNGYIWPTKGVITSGYGPRWGRMHRGIDIAGPIGTPVMAAASGEVVFAGWNSGGYGNLVKVRHPNGSVTFYAHNSRILVRRGQQVEQGQQISEMGSTGYSTGPHLHFEVHPNGQGAANPVAYLPQNR